MTKREIDWNAKEEGEAELLCYECGAYFRTPSYFLRHRRAHRNAEICGVLMTEDSWRGMVGNDSDTEEGDDAVKEGMKKKRKRVEQVGKNSKEDQSVPGSK